ncbi:MAG: ATP-binding protein [Verrucomicrobiota bacterium]
MQSQKMEAIGTLAGGIAHDFNNILGGIIGFTELSKAGTKDNRQVQEYLGSVLQASRRAADLVRQILTFSRRQDQRRDIVQLRQLVAESMKLLRASIPSTVEFDVRLDASVAPVLADATQIHQALINLCSNAEHAMRGRSGRLEVRLGNVHVDARLAEDNPRLVPGDYVRLSVADNGVGMAADVHARVFEPFFTTKPPGEGTGLGLSVVHGVMESHDGAVVVESKPGEGTRFDLYFPARTGPETMEVAPDTPIPLGRGEHVLFVEDEEPLAVFGRVALERLGYRVTACTMPAQALQALRDDPAGFDLVVTDHTMPGMTGVDLAIEARRLVPGLPVILATGYSAGVVSARAKEAGLETILFKPLDLRTLGTAIHDCLRAKTP